MKYLSLSDVRGDELDQNKTWQAIYSCRRDIFDVVGDQFASNRLDGVRVLFSRETKYSRYTIKQNHIFSWLQRLAELGDRERMDDFCQRC